MSNKKIKSTLRRYKRKFRIMIIILIAVSCFVLFIAVEKIFGLLNTIEKIKSAINIDIKDVKENLYFEDGIFYATIPKPNSTIQSTFNVQKSLNSHFSILNKNFIYKVQGVNGEILIVPKDFKMHTDKILISSKFADFTNSMIKIYSEVEGKFYTEEDVFDFTFEKATFDSTQNITADMLFITGKTGYIKAGKVITTDFLNVVKLNNGIKSRYEQKDIKANYGIVNLENSEIKTVDLFEDVEFQEEKSYNLKSPHIILFFENKVLQKANFAGRVKFIDFQNETKVEGDFATYNALTKEIFIYNNVVISSAKNNLLVKSESFTYNENTKQGSFNKQAETSKRVKIELDV